MTSDTSKNPVIIVAEYALQTIRRSFRTKLGFRPIVSKNELETLLHRMESSLMALKYSYLSLAELLAHNELKELKNSANLILEAIKPGLEIKSTNKLAYATLEWGINVISGIPRRLGYKSDQLGAGVDIKVLRVQNVKPFGKFIMTRAYDDKRTYTIMTNLIGIKPNHNLAAAFLPPIEVGNQLSEAMFLGLEEREEQAGEYLNPAKAPLKEINAILHQVLKK
jgi:predicted RNA-binding protein with EMAP domain